MRFGGVSFGDRAARHGGSEVAGSFEGVGDGTYGDTELDKFGPEGLA